MLSAYASDGGLYVPEHLPTLPENYRTLWKELSFPDVCAEVFHLFCDIDVAVLRELCAESYKDFNDGVHHLPLHHFDDLYLLDTSLGPTLAFKDVGQQIMGKIINYLLAQRGERGNIVVETSGDTGPAAIAGVRGSSNMNIFCLYPHGRVSEVQELQMVTVDAPNVFVYRTEGNTDEQASVLKEIFDDHAFLERHHIFSVNSINIGRIIAQSSYFIWASLQFSEAIAAAGLTVVIPTGAFGNAMGAYFARLMGAPLGRIVCATNANDIVHRTIAYGDLRLDENRQVRHHATPTSTSVAVGPAANPASTLSPPPSCRRSRRRWTFSSPTISSVCSTTSPTKTAPPYAASWSTSKRSTALSVTIVVRSRRWHRRSSRKCKRSSRRTASPMKTRCVRSRRFMRVMGLCCVRTRRRRFTSRRTSWAPHRRQVR